MKTRTRSRSRYSGSSWVHGFGRFGAALLALAIAAGGAGCKNPDAILIRTTADEPVEQVAIFVYDNVTRAEVFHSGWNSVTRVDDKQPRDITKSALKIALKLDSKGDFTIMMLGAIGPVVKEPFELPVGTKQFFWAGKVKVTGTEEVRAHLYAVPAADDLDRDYWPSATRWLVSTPTASAEFGNQMDLLDCYDEGTDNPKMTTTNKTVDASKIHPFAPELCGDGVDEACNGPDDETCMDIDGDGDPAGSDCDDNNAARHHATTADPYPDPPNCCGYNLGFLKGTADGNKSYAGDPVLCPSVRCGDGIDNACKGIDNNASNDTKCVIDADCDGFSPPADCDDNDPLSYPGAPEPCGGTKDLNCSGQANDGCVPCDLDGDGFQRNDAANGCPNNDNKNPGKFDCNDYDAGVFPMSTSFTPTTRPGSLGGTEGGGTSLQSKVESALRGNCRTSYEATGAGTPRVGSFGQLPGDFDCDGVAYSTCPTTACDADGDGFPNANAGCPISGIQVDCNDNDATIFFGAPDKCGDGILQDCVQDRACAGDTDGDGYVGAEDCGEGDATRHPFAVEVCNGVDDDCDGLVDEGNPDTAGNPLVASGAVITCTDSDIGECGKTRGTCVCSAAPPNSTFDPNGMRDACPTELAATGGTKDKCFAAGQPQQQSCNPLDPKDDDCDGRVDAPEGTKLAILGQTCGTDTGECKVGTVVGCNMAQTSCFTALDGTLYNPWIVCSSDAICPTAEICNGKDDDCNGGLPTNEQDQDGDKYMACAGPCADLATGLTGCDDCADSAPVNGVAAVNIHPTAIDSCNGVDDNCAGGLTDDGENCPAGTAGAPGGHPACCGSGTPSCKDLFASSEIAHCTSCNNACSATVADRCSPTGCVCGATGAACGGTDNCTNANSEVRCRKQAGGACTLGNECLSNNCVDGFCCNTACTGQCERCDATPGTCTQTVGAPKTGSTPSRSACTDTDGDSCDGTCDATGGRNACHYFATPQGTNLCPAASCQSTSVQRNAVTTCNSNGDCAAQTTTNCAGPTCGAGGADGFQQTVTTCTGTACAGVTTTCGDFKCNGTNTACLANCTMDSDCSKAGKPYCSLGACVAKRPAGSVCSGAAECSVQCLGHCCTASCPQNVCASNALTVNTCDASGACVVFSGPTACGGGNYLCANGTTCASGSCSCTSGGPAPCEDSAKCSSTAYCNTSSCLDRSPNGTGCTDPDMCDSDSCQDGTCCSAANCGPCGNCGTGTCNALGEDAAPKSSCGFYLCTAGSTDCPGAGSCADDTDCVAGAYCDLPAGNCVMDKSSGTCTTASQCGGGFCEGPALDGNKYCCDEACAPGAQCNGALTARTATACINGTTCTAQAPIACNGNQYCSAGVCVSDVGNGVGCTADAMCTNGPCGTDTTRLCCASPCTGTCETTACTAGGACGAAAASTVCNTNYVCGGASTCPSSCTNGSQCAIGSWCNGGVCTTTKIAGGQACDDANCGNGGGAPVTDCNQCDKNSTTQCPGTGAGTCPN